MSKDIEHVIADGKTAERLLTDEVFLSALAELESECVGRWRGSRTGETVIREEAYHRLKALDRIRELIGITKDRGSKARIDLDAQQQRGPRRAGRNSN